MRPRKPALSLADDWCRAKRLLLDFRGSRSNRWEASGAGEGHDCSESASTLGAGSGETGATRLTVGLAAGGDGAAAVGERWLCERLTE